MDTIQYNQLLSFIWNIASDVLVNVFEKGDYKKVIMPFLVLRRIDVLLEPTKQEVIEKKKWIDVQGLTSSQDEILFKVTKYPFYNTSNFTLKILKSEGDPKQLHKHFIEYLDGFSSDVIDIIDKFKLKQLVENLTDAERLGSIIDKFTDDRYNLSNKPILDDNDKVVQPALDNHTMGTIFEELLRRFNEENNVTEAGEHFTPRDYVKLMADLAVIPVADKITDNTYHIYDAACGTGGILTIAQERIEEIAREHGKQVQVKIFGQEQQPDTYATCKAELMISGHIKSFHYQLGTEQKEYIAYDSTLSRDGHRGETFDFCISNPPFGIPWKEDLKKWGIEEKKKNEITDTRFIKRDETNIELSFIPNIDDSQMLFLANNISRMREDTALGTRIVEVHDGSSLFSGDAGSGPSNLRKYIIEHDLLETVIAMPENDFYNTGIGTYIWVLTNRKEPKRQGYVQLIDATDIKTTLRKNLGKKNCETNKKDREKIMKLYMDFKPTAQCKIFPNKEFGYWSVKVERPLRESIILNRDTLQRALDILGHKNVDFSQECRDRLIANGIIVAQPDDIPEVKEGSSIFDERYSKYRKMKLPKSVDQYMADVVLSQAFVTFCDMMKEKELWLDVQEFEHRFDEVTLNWGLKLKFSKIESLLPIFRERNPDASPVIKNGKKVADTKLRNTEIIPFNYEGGIEGFLNNEILPYTPDAWIDEKSITTGCKLQFSKYFYKPKEKIRDLDSLDNLIVEIKKIQTKCENLLEEILDSRKMIKDALTKGINSDVKMKDSGIEWIGLIPEHWELRRIKYVFDEIKEKSISGLEQPLSLSKTQGVIPFHEKKNRTLESASYVGGKIVHPGEIVFNRFKARLFAVSNYEGIVSSDYAVYKCKDNASAEYMVKLLSTDLYRAAFNRKASGIGDGFNRLYTDDLFSMYAVFPPLSEQISIVSFINERCRKIDELNQRIEAESELLQDLKKRLIADCVTGKLKD